MAPVKRSFEDDNGCSIDIAVDADNDVYFDGTWVSAAVVEDFLARRTEMYLLANEKEKPTGRRR